MGLRGYVAIALALTCGLLPAPARSQELRCSYFTAVHREPKPEFLDEDFSDVTWSQRPLIPPPDRDDICIENYFSAGSQIIYIEEEIVGEVIVAKINYDGTATPTIGTFITGPRTLLDPVIRHDTDNGWHLVITERQDYETEIMRIYMFNVDIWENDVSPLRVLVSLNVINIDDNPPAINLIGSCTVEELGEPRATECVYNVTDIDGQISIERMYFTIEGSLGVGDLFSIDEELFSNDWYRMEITLRIQRALDFAASALHIFSVTAHDSLPNTHTVSLMVQVENVEHRSPRWVEIWAMQKFDEKTNQTFSVSAIDGDTGINKEIHYRLNNPDNYTFFSIGEEDGIFNVKPIDRDELEQEVFQLQIVAYKFDNDSYSTESTIVIIVDDVNDQLPNPLHPLYEVSILEETPMSLTFEQEFGFHDRDLGSNAQYHVRLESVNPPEAASAFTVAPDQGYQRQTFIMSVMHHGLLDYEDLEWQEIELNFVAEEVFQANRTGRATVRIHLINWNDEEPIFEQDLYEVQFNETEGAGFYVATVTAHDRDIDDKVVHSLMGNAINFLNIDPDTGEITVAIDDAFDYLRQNEIFVQVRADDTLGEGPYHTATTQLHIKLLDVNNNPPQLRLPRTTPIVEENVPDGYVITSEIAGSDPDTTADIYFEIDWDDTYATKQGRSVDQQEYVGCVEILTIYPDEYTRGSANGSIVVREIRNNVTIDFEEFEVLYLIIRVVDRNQVIGDDYAVSTFTIIIEDMNDNPPIWTEGTLDTAFAVREVSNSGVVIGSVHATDIDGPLYNQVRYSIYPREETPDGLVSIDALMGQIVVSEANAIDADTPPRENLYYTVVASDCCTVDCPPPDPTCYDVPGEITIRIIDTNNKIPEALEDEYDSLVYIYEKSDSGQDVVDLSARDLDRDDIYKTVTYQINYAVNPNLRDFFAVEADTGRVYVNYTGDVVLDRDRGEPRHQIFLNIFDNFFSEGDGNRNQVEINVTVILLDINDQSPELPLPSILFWSISEGLTEGSIIGPDIYAPDIDEENTDRSRVSYDIISLTLTNRDIEHPEMFGMINVDNVTGELYCVQDLRGYWGTYDIHILAYDFGIPQQLSNETYELIVRPYNFNSPVYVYPTAGTTVRLSRERANVNSLLTLANGQFLDRIEATDEDGLEAGIVTFAVTGNALAEQYFTVTNDGTNQGTLILTQMITEDQVQFQVTITATDQGTEPGPLSTSVSMTIYFVVSLGDPTFLIDTDSAAFIEFEEGLAELHQLHLADDPKNLYCDGDCYNIYYYIYDGDTDNHFTLDPQTNVLRVVNALNRTEAETYILTIGASNSPTRPDVRPGPGSVLTVNVAVREANPRPRFERDLYTAGISTYDTFNRELLFVTAIHSDGNTIAYTIDFATMVVDSSLEAVKDIAFTLNPQSGLLLLNLQPTASMHGMFEFDVVATDTAGATDRTSVKVYLISGMNRVFFTFVNSLTQVEQGRDFIANTFSEGFSMTCNIDLIVPASDDNGVALDDLTEVRAHFIDNDVPVDVELIELKRSDTALLRSIQTSLSTRDLLMQDFVTESSNDNNSSPSIEQVMSSLIAAVAMILAVMCIILLLAYFFKTRALNRRLDALSTTKFGSQDSGLNRAGVVVPGTNKHAVEGSNPMWNEQAKAPDFDALSDISGDSDLIGIEDNPQFSYDYLYPDAPADHGTQRGVQPQPEVHASPPIFNSSPFSPDFADNKYNNRF